LGLSNQWAPRPIHPCGIAEEASAGLAAFLLKKIGGRPFASAFRGFAQSREVVEQVADDPAAIGFASANRATPETKLVLSFDRYLTTHPPQPLDPFVKEYLQMALSKDGQIAIGAAPPGYLPLGAAEVTEELRKLGSPAVPSHPSRSTPLYEF